jgi:replicative DNA helicase
MSFAWKTPALEAEAAALGAALLSRPAAIEVAGALKPSDFAGEGNATVFRAIESLVSRDIDVDFVTVKRWLVESSNLDSIGGVARLVELAESCDKASHARSYIRVVIESATERRMGEANVRLQGILSASDTSVAEKAELMRKEVEDATARLGNSSKMRSAMDIVTEFGSKMQSCAEAGHMPIGLQTGLKSIDQFTTGFYPGQLVILAARPSMGKTALATAIMLGACDAGTVVMFSMEMSSEEVIKRIVAMYSGMSGRDMKSIETVTNNWDDLFSACEVVGRSPLYIDDSTALTVEDILTRCRAIAREKPLSLVVVDYLQLMKLSRARGIQRREEIDEISRGLKMIAKELSVPVLALCQLNRDVEKRADKRPQMSDIRESGGIEQDADLIMMLYRDSVYSGVDTPVERAELIVVKFRNGDMGTIGLDFEKRLALFRDPVRPPV